RVQQHQRPDAMSEERGEFDPDLIRLTRSDLVRIVWIHRRPGNLDSGVVKASPLQRSRGRLCLLWRDVEIDTQTIRHIARRWRLLIRAPRLKPLRARPKGQLQLLRRVDGMLQHKPSMVVAMTLSTRGE